MNHRLIPAFALGVSLMAPLQAHAQTYYLLDDPRPSTPIPSSSQSLLGYRMYLGDLHAHPRGHSETDAAYVPRRDPNDCFVMAKLTGADFWASTNHDGSEINSFWYGHETTSGVPTMTLWEAWRARMPGAWYGAGDEYLNQFYAADAHTDATFVGIGAYERTLSQSWQHLNVFNMMHWTQGDSPADAYASLKGMIDAGADPIIQFNHPNTTQWEGFAYHPEVADHFFQMEVKDDDGFNSFRLALNNGWRLSPTNTSDWHTAWYSNNHPGDMRQYAGRTGIALPEGTPLTRDNLFQALRARRTLATPNKELTVFYTVNGLPMGSVLPASNSLHFDVVATNSHANRADATASNIQKIELWTSSSASPLKVLYFNQQTATASFDVLPYYKNYFLRVVQVTNDQSLWETATAAPVWTGSQLPMPRFTSPTSAAYVTTGDQVQVTWTGGPSKVNLSVRKYSAGTWRNTPVATGATNTGMFVFDTTRWGSGRFQVFVTDPDQASVRWYSPDLYVDIEPL